MLIIGTTSSAAELEELGLIEAFDRKIHVPNLTKNEILNVLKNYECKSCQLLEDDLQFLRHFFFQLPEGVKNFL